MQFGKTLIGGIIGAALGIGLLIAVYLALGIDKMWMAIPVAVLTGFGVRMVAATSGRASYLRGAITVVLAMAAYLGGLAFTRTVANHRAQTVAKMHPPRAAAEESAAPGDAKTGEPGEEAPPVAAAPIEPASVDRVLHPPAMPTQFSTWDFISLAVAALFAYELGRGSDAAAGDSLSAEPSGQVPVNTHPDA